MFAGSGASAQMRREAAPARRSASAVWSIHDEPSHLPPSHAGGTPGVGMDVDAGQRRDPPQRRRPIAAGEPLFEGVIGYEHTVMPQLENALLAGHDVIFLGERGQAKTRIIRSLTGLLDEWMPIVARQRDQRRSVRAGQPPRARPDRRAWATTRRSTGCIATTASARSWPRPTPRSPTSSARSTRSRSPRAATSATSSRCTTAWCRAPTAASSRSTRSPTSPSASRSVCSTCSKSATCRSAATRSACRSTSCWSPAPTPRTTPTAAASSRR